MMFRGTTARFTIVLSVLLLGLVTIQVVGLMAQRSTTSAADRRIQVAGDVGKIRYYDELLTMSARLAAATGDTSYVQRYHRAVPELSATLEDAFMDVPDADATRAPGTPTMPTTRWWLWRSAAHTLAAGHRTAAYREVTSMRSAS